MVVILYLLEKLRVASIVVRIAPCEEKAKLISVCQENIMFLLEIELQKLQNQLNSAA